MTNKNIPCNCFFATIISEEYGLWDCPFPSCIFESEYQEEGVEFD